MGKRKGARATRRRCTFWNSYSTGRYLGTMNRNSYYGITGIPPVHNYRVCTLKGTVGSMAVSAIGAEDEPSMLLMRSMMAQAQAQAQGA